MEKENWKEFTRIKHVEYKKIGHVECPAFNNEKIYFNKHGFNHLRRKDGIPRPRNQQIKRMCLLSEAKMILATLNNFFMHETREGEPIADFWIFKAKINSVEIKVVVRRLGNGRKHFFSVMDRS